MQSSKIHYCISCTNSIINFGLVSPQTAEQNVYYDLSLPRNTDTFLLVNELLINANLLLLITPQVDVSFWRICQLESVNG